MTKNTDEEILKKICDLFEIKPKKITLTSKISKYFQLDSLNQLKLMGFIDEKLRTFNDIVKLIND